MPDPIRIAGLALAITAGAVLLDIVIGRIVRRYRHWRVVRRAIQRLPLQRPGRAQQQGVADERRNAE